MPRLYSYIVKNDNGSAPNPFWGVCTLTICKPVIRRTAQIGDWIVGTGSKNSKLRDGKTHDLSGHLVYAMQVTDKMSLHAYDQHCLQHLNNKVPNWRTSDWRMKMGDCIYDFSAGVEPAIRMSVHKENNRERDLGGLYALLSNHFYYFGEEPRPIPASLREIVIKTQGHLVFDDPAIIKTFEKWKRSFTRNKIYAHPQRRYLFDRREVKTASISNNKKC